MKKVNRRSFLRTSGGVAAGAALGLGTLPTASALGSNERINVGVAGLKGRGGNHIGGFRGLAGEGVRVTGLCDVDTRQIDMRMNGFKKKDKKDTETAELPKRFQDVRKMLDDKDIHAISIATPNHWHSLIGIWACQAGKDVYVEKPCSHNVFEGRQLVEAAKKYKRVVQHGTQIRSSEAVREAMEKLEEGVIGDVYMARGLCYKWRNTIGRKKPEAPPKEVDYNIWLGPAPTREFTQNRFHYNWHWHWDYGNGDMGNQGVHQMDVARWGLGVGLPSKIQGMGHHFMFEDDQETPNTIGCSYWYPDEEKMLVFETRHWISNGEGIIGGSGNAIGITFYGSEGYMQVPSYGSYKTWLGRKREEGPSASKGGNHYANFIAAVKARDPEVLHAPIEEGHYSAALCHLGNVAYQVGRTLEFDPETEQVVGDDEANALLTRPYRAPFVVPTQV